MRGLLLALLVLAAALMGDARPGWCPFADPTPGAEVCVPHVAPPAVAPPPPPMVSYPSFDRAKDVAPSLPRCGDNSRPARTRPPASRDHAASATPATPSPWSDNPLVTTSAALLLLLLGVLPLLWIRRAATNPTLPADLVNRRWRGWTQRTPR